MTQAVAHIFEEAEQLSASERAELAELIVETLHNDSPSDLAEAQMSIVRQRIAQVESGEVKVIPGQQALNAVAEKMVAMRTLDYLRAEAAAGRREDFDRFLTAVPDKEPDVDDRLSS